MKEGYIRYDGWKSMIHTNESLTPYDIWCIQRKCRYVAAALKIVLTKYPSTFKFIDCCKEAIDLISKVNGEEEERPSVRTIQKWHNEFRVGNESFKVSSKYSRRDRLPPLLDANPDLKDSILTHAKENLGTFSVDMILDFIKTKALPDLLEKRRDEMIRNDEIARRDEYTMEMLLKAHLLVSLSRSTVGRWIQQLGFNYCNKQKTYYVDGHEKEENVTYRKKYIRTYLHREIRCHRWVQLPEQIVIMLESDSSIKYFNRKYGYEYLDDNHHQFYEFHVDVHECLAEYIKDLRFGGNLSVRKKADDKPLIMIGQDECIFKQYTMHNRQWKLPDGTQQILPKDDGAGVMISSFVSRDYGYGLDVSDSVLNEMNERRKDECYVDVDAAKVVYHGTIQKKPLTNSPFTRNFDYGANREGYWSYDHLVIQLEDCLDILKVINGDTYDYVFYFDHSTGHDRMRPDGLNASNMNKGYGGSQASLHDSMIESEEYLGKYEVEGKLKIGDIQYFTFKESDIGPYWLAPAERIKLKHDTQLGEGIRGKRLNVNELTKQLNCLPHINIEKKMKYADLKIMATDNEVSLYSLVVPGWVNTPKGMMQVLCECGFIDPSLNFNRHYKEKKGKLNEDGTYDSNLCYRKLCNDLPDFKNEVSLLVYNAGRMGVTVDSSPKYHPEIAGEGIEYCWGCSKQWYRAQPLKMKRNKEKFYLLVQQAMDTKNILTCANIRKFGLRQRVYMLSYLCLEEISDSEHEISKLSVTPQQQQQSTNLNNITQSPTQSTQSTEQSTSLLTIYERSNENGNTAVAVAAVDNDRNREIVNPNSELSSHRVNRESLPRMSCELVERVMKTFRKQHRSHRNVLDQDTAFLKTFGRNGVSFVDKHIEVVKTEVGTMTTNDVSLL